MITEIAVLRAHIGGDTGQVVDTPFYLYASHLYVSACGSAHGSTRGSTRDSTRVSTRVSLRLLVHFLHVLWGVGSRGVKTDADIKT